VDREEEGGGGVGREEGGCRAVLSGDEESEESVGDEGSSVLVGIL
jgi:hypothetical protein